MSMSNRDLATIHDYTTLTPEVRAFLTAKLEQVIEAMDPYVDGTFELSPAIAQVYLRALRELGLLYRVYDRPGEKEETVEVAPQLALEAVRAEVGAQLAELAARTGAVSA